MARSSVSLSNMVGGVEESDVEEVAATGSARLPPLVAFVSDGFMVGAVGVDRAEFGERIMRW